MNRFLYAEANPWTFSDPSGHASLYEGGGCGPGGKYCGSHGQDQTWNENYQQVEHQSDYVDPCDTSSGSTNPACGYHPPKPSSGGEGTPQSTPTIGCGSSICNPNAPSTTTEIRIQWTIDWTQVWASVGKSGCTQADPCVPGLACPIVPGPCLPAPWSNPVSEYECDAECQAEGFRLAAVATAVTAGAGACVLLCGAAATGVGTALSPFWDRIKGAFQSIPAQGPSSALPILPSAQQKLDIVAQKIGQSASDVLAQVMQNGTRYIDNGNAGNINVLLQRPDTGPLIRITLDPTGQRVISAGFVQLRSLINGINDGRFTLAP